MSKSPTFNPPPAEVCLGDRKVDCECDPKLHRPVLLDPWLGSLGIHACLGCGRVTATETRGDEGRYTGEAWQANFKIELPADVLAWLAQWPRAKFTWHNGIWPMAAELVQRDVSYLPYDTRCATAAALEQLEAKAVAEHKTVSMGEWMRALGGPTAAPPAGLPQALWGFDFIWQALRMPPEASLPLLMKFAQLRSPASPLAVDRLLQRADFPAIMFAALRHEDSTWRSAGLAMARAHRPLAPGLIRLLIELMAGGSLAPLPDVPQRVVGWDRYELILLLIVELKLDAPEVIAALHGLRRRLARHDPDLVEKIGTVLNRLTGEPILHRRSGAFLP